MVTKLGKNFPQYIGQAKHIVKKQLPISFSFDGIPFDRKIINQYEYFIIPMIDVTKDISEYKDGDSLFDYIRIKRKAEFWAIIVFSNGNYIACCSRTEHFPYACMIPDNIYDTTKSFLIDLNRVKSFNPDYVVYIRGFLHTWWLLKENGEVMVYYLLTKQFYDYHEFMDLYLPPERIRAVVEHYYRF